MGLPTKIKATGNPTEEVQKEMDGMGEFEIGELDQDDDDLDDLTPVPESKAKAKTEPRPVEVEEEIDEDEDDDSLEAQAARDALADGLVTGPVVEKPKAVKATDPEPTPAPAGVNPFDVGLEPAASPSAIPSAPAPSTPVAAAPTPAPATPVPEATEATTGKIRSMFTPEEIKILGGDKVTDVLANVMERARAADAAEIASLRKTTATAAEQQQIDRVNNFRSNIAESVTQYAEVIGSRSWQQFLQRPNPLQTGKTMQDALIDADRRLDKGAVLHVFDTFKKEYAPKEEPKPKGDPLARRATVGKAAAAANHTPSVKYAYKESDVERWDLQKRQRTIDSVTYSARVAKYEKALAEGKVQLGA